jgi:hypothetical protein
LNALEESDAPGFVKIGWRNGSSGEKRVRDKRLRKPMQSCAIFRVK